ncbi:MAG: bifunctional demethylmenaquinone methyltransferase/2-methoxy-6-polyprenyl-1,4-benzoquinol methylase UbiE [Bacteroidota bacterium]|nr:bifunctional demethylmenaquinone methyltransferase/2-methoxy-6-polyprenyl-1,4-benzoquinol methylase UbiE [Bacteroidota bacterium]
MDTVLPYKDKKSSKKEQVAEMFNNISPKYDFLNHFLSVGIDFYWRKKAIQLLKKYQPNTILDIATGTGDFAIQALELKPHSVVGIDISQGMLDFGNIKLKKKSLDKVISLTNGDAENIQFEDNSFDTVISAFGVRNFQNLEKGLQEIYRVLKSGQPLVILEFSKPNTFPVKQIFQFYFKFILPLIGKLVSKDASAYEYLPESVQVFPEGNQFIEVLRKIGYKNCTLYPLTFGICTIYLGEK